MQISSEFIAFIVYLMNQVDAVDTFVGWMIAILVAVIVFSSFFTALTMENGEKDVRDNVWEMYKTHIINNRKTLIAVFVGLCFMKAIIPTSESMKEIAIAYGAVEILKTDTAKEIGSRVSSIVSKAADAVERKLDNVEPVEKTK